MGYRGIIKADKTFEKILSFEPQKFQPLDMATLDDKVPVRPPRDSDFKIAEVVRDFTGLKERELQEVEATIERKVLDQLKTIEERAYKEAYHLGLDEGKKEAFKNFSNEINEKLNALNDLLIYISNMKANFLKSNESHIIKLVYQLAKRIAFCEVSEKYNEAIVNVLSESIKLAHSDEKIRVHISDKQVEFLDSLKKENSRDLEYLRQVELVSDENIQVGGCIITTNYGEVDARIEQRVEQLWLAIKDTIPPIKEVVDK